MKLPLMKGGVRRRMIYFFSACGVLSGSDLLCSWFSSAVPKFLLFSLHCFFLFHCGIFSPVISWIEEMQLLGFFFFCIRCLVSLKCVCQDILCQHIYLFSACNTLNTFPSISLSSMVLSTHPDTL